MTRLFLAAAAAALLAAPASAAELRTYTSHADSGDHPGREYTVRGVRVVEGQPRWATQRRTVADEVFAEPEDRSVTTIVNVGRRYRRPY